MASMLSVQQKMYRAKEHYVELRESLVQYYESKSVKFMLETNGSVRLVESTPLPQRFGLMFGDCLQCQRSSLDYLVYELAEKNGGKHHNRNSFPIATTQKIYEENLRGHYLDGIVPDAKLVIKELQPWKTPHPERHPLAILDRLTNINKHRRICTDEFR